MKHIKVVGLCLAAVLAMSMSVVATASAAAHHWTRNAAEETVPKGETSEIVAKLKPGTTATLESEIITKPVTISCKKLKLTKGAGIVNGEDPTNKELIGRDVGAVEFEECKLEGEASLVCKLTKESAEKIRVPPTGNGESVLVESKNGKKEIWDDFLPETVSKIFAIINVEGSLCPVRQDIVRTKLTVGLPATAQEGEGGVVAKIEPGTHAKIQTLVFPVSKTTVELEAVNGLGNNIKVNEIWDEPKEGRIEEGKLAKFAAEVEVELVSGKEFGVK